MNLDPEALFPGDNAARVRQFIVRYLPYVPLIIVFFVAGLIAAFTNLRYSHFVYETRARVILAVEQSQTKDDKSGLLKLSLGNTTSSPEEKAFELFQSKEQMVQVVKKLKLYAEVVSKGRFITKPTFGSGSPLSITSASPDSIFQENLVDLKIFPDKNQVCLNGTCYPAGRFVQTAFGTFRFDLKPNYLKTPLDGELQFHTIPVNQEADDILGRLRLVSKGTPSNIFGIVLQDEIPERSQATIPMMIKVYDSLSAVKQKEADVNIIHFIDQRVKVVADELDQIEQELQDYKAHSKTDNLQAEGTVYFAKTQELDQELSTLYNQIKLLEDIEAYLKRNYKTGNSIPSLVELNNTSLSGQLIQLFELQAQLEKQNKISGAGNPETTFLEERVAELKPAILGSIENLKRNYLITRKNIQADLERYSQLLTKVPNLERKLLDITRRQEAKNVIFTYLLQKKEEVSLNSASIYPNTQILEKPVGADLVSPVISQIYTIYSLVAIALAFGIITIIEALDNSIKSRSEFDRVLTPPIIGEIHKITNFDLNRPIVIGKSIKTVSAEQFRSLRTNLNYLGLDSKHKVILVTSSIMREGKSFLSLNLAISLSLSGKKVVLMDFDFRKPKISAQLAPNNPPGITNYLVGNATLKEIIHEVPEFSNLYLAPSGTIPPNPSEIILGKLMPTLIQTMRNDFDYVLIDSPPVGIVTDAKLLAPYIDLTLYVIRQGVTPRVFLRSIESMHQEKVLPNMGLIVNDIKNTKFNDYGYGYGYDYSNESKNNTKESKFVQWIKNLTKG